MASSISESQRKELEVGSQANSVTNGSKVSDQVITSQVSTASDPGSPARTTSNGSQAIRDKCTICSQKTLMGYETGDVYHSHFSSKFLRNQAAEQDNGKTFPCPSCKKEHEIEPFWPLIMFYFG